MAPPLRDLPGREVIQAFVRAGGEIKSGKGDHINIKMPNGMIVTVPNKRTIGFGLLSQQIKRAGMTKADFMKHLR